MPVDYEYLFWELSKAVGKKLVSIDRRGSGSGSGSRAP